MSIRRLISVVVFLLRLPLPERSHPVRTADSMAIPYSDLARRSRPHPTSEGHGLEHSYHGILISHRLRLR